LRLTLAAIGVLLVVSLLVSSLVVPCGALFGAKGGLARENHTDWANMAGNLKVASVAVGDVDGDTDVEVVSVDVCSDGTAQIVVRNAATFGVENSVSWRFSNQNTNVTSVAVGDVDGDPQVEIVTGGSFWDGTRFNGLVQVWTGANLSLERSLSWYWTSNTYVASLAIGDVNGDDSNEVVIGGGSFDFSRWLGFVNVLNGSSLSSLYGIGWYWTSNTLVNSVVVGDVDSDYSLEVVVGGTTNNYVRTLAFVAVLSGAGLAVENVLSWNWVVDTVVTSVSFGDVSGGFGVVAVGAFYDGVRWIAWVATLALSGFTLAPLCVLTWFWSGDTRVSSVAVADVDLNGVTDIIIGGGSFSGSRDVGFLVLLRGSDLAVEDVGSWWTLVNGASWVTCVAVGNVDSDISLEFVSGGYFYGGSRDDAELAVWSRPPVAVTIWGSQQYAEYNETIMGGTSEKLLSGQVAGDVMTYFGNTGRYIYQYPGWGEGTYPANVYTKVNACESDYALSVFFYKGHSWEVYKNATYNSCGVPGCQFQHYSVYDNEGPQAPGQAGNLTNNDGVIADYLIHEQMSSFTHGLVVLWTCGSAWQNATGGFSGSHSWGWEASFMGTTSLSSDGYQSPDGSGRCFIGFDNFSIWYRTSTLYQSNNYGDFIRQFFNYTLKGYNIRQSLDLATIHTHNSTAIPSYRNCTLYTGYTMVDPRSPWPNVTCWMRVRGDGDLIIPS